MTKLILQTREQSSMASCWEEHLCIESTDDGFYRISQCQYEILGSIYDFVSYNELFDENGEMVVPEQINGVPVFGLADGEYVQTDNLEEESLSEPFNHESLTLAETFISNLWWSDADLGSSWEEICQLVEEQRKI